MLPAWRDATGRARATSAAASGNWIDLDGVRRLQGKRSAKAGIAWKRDGAHGEDAGLPQKNDKKIYVN